MVGENRNPHGLPGHAEKNPQRTDGDNNPAVIERQAAGIERFQSLGMGFFDMNGISPVVRIEVHLIFYLMVLVQYIFTEFLLTQQ